MSSAKLSVTSNRVTHDSLEPRVLFAGTIPSKVLFQDGYSDVLAREFTPAIMEKLTVIGGNTANASLVNTLRSQGKLFLHNVGYNSSLTVSQLVAAWSAPFNNTLGGALAGGFDGIEIDEVLWWTNGSADSNKFISALSQLRSMYPNKVIGVYNAMSGDSLAPYSNLWNAINTNADLNLFEAYLRENNPGFSSLANWASNIAAFAPGLINKTIFALFSAQAGDPGDNSTSTGFLGFLDEQMHTLRNSSAGSQMPGLGSYVYSQQATTWYMAKAMEHYYVLGNTGYFGDGDYAQDVVNPSFESNTSNWLLTAGAGGTIARVSYSGSGVPQTHDQYGETSHGAFALKSVRGTSGNAASYSMTVVPSKTYTVSAFVTATSGAANNAKVKIATTDGSVFAERRVADVSQLNNVEPWKRIYYTFRVPAGVTTVNVVLTDEATPTGTTLFWDWIEAEDNGAPLPPISIPEPARESTLFNHQYNGDVYPVPNYAKNGPFNSPGPSTDGDIFAFRAPTGGGYFASSDWAVTNSIGFTIEFRIKIDTDADEGSKGAFALYYGDGTAGDILTIGKEFTSGGIGTIPLDASSNTDGYHTFRISKSFIAPNQNPIDIYRDGVRIGYFPNGGNYGSNVLLWGSGGSLFGGPTVHMDYMRWDNTGGYAPLNGWSGTSGDWNFASNWGGGVPNMVDASAVFSKAGSTSETVYSNSAITVGSLKFNSTNSYAIASMFPLTLYSTSTSTIDVLQGNQKLNIPTIFATDAAITVASGASLTLGNPITVRANRTVTRTGNVLIQAPLTIETGGTFVVAGPVLAAITGAPILGTGATVHIQNGAMDVNYAGQSSPAAVIRAQLTSGYDGGGWDGEGINTANSVPGEFGLGWVDDAASSVVHIRDTYYGDASLNGTVDSADFNQLAGNFGTTNAFWSQGDFNYDSRINTVDFNYLAGNFGKSMSGVPAAGASPVVPLRFAPNTPGQMLFSNVFAGDVVREDLGDDVLNVA